MHQSWAELIAELTEEAGSQSALARQIGVKPQTVQRWVSGEIAVPDVPQLRALAATTRYSLPYLIAVANGVPLEEMADGAGHDLLPFDHQLAEEERGHIHRQYGFLRRLSKMMRGRDGAGV